MKEKVKLLTVEVQTICKSLWLNGLQRYILTPLIKNGLSNSCIKYQFIPMVSFVSIKDLKLKTKILSAVKLTKKQYIVNLIVITNL